MNDPTRDKLWSDVYARAVREKAETNLGGKPKHEADMAVRDYDARLAAPGAALAAREQEARHLREGEPPPPPGERVPACEKCGGCREWGGNGLWHHAGCSTKQGAAWLQTASRDEAPAASAQQDAAADWGIDPPALAASIAAMDRAGETGDLIMGKPEPRST